VYQIYKDFEVKISINDLFKNITLEKQALLIENITHTYFDDNELDENDSETFNL